MLDPPADDPANLVQLMLKHRHAGACTYKRRASTQAKTAGAVRRRRAPAPLPSDADPLVQLVKINESAEHQQPGGDQFVALPGSAGEPPAGDHPGALCADIVAVLSDLAEMID